MGMTYTECSRCARELWMEREWVENLPLDLHLCLPCLRPDLFFWHKDGYVWAIKRAPYKGTPGIEPHHDRPQPE